MIAEPTSDARISPTGDTGALAPLIEQALALAAAQGATAAEAGISVEAGLSVAVRMGEIETIEHHQSRGFGITVYRGQQKGSASSSDLSERALKETVAAALRIARHAAEDPAAGLPDVDWLAQEIPDLDLHHPWPITPERAADRALSAEAAALAVHSDIRNSEGAQLNTFEGYRILGNSHGFLHGYASSRHSLSVSVIGERKGEMQRDDWWSVARRSDALESPEDIGRMAGERALKRLGARRLSSRKCSVIFAAEVASSLLGHFIGAIRGGNLYRKSSFLLDHLGKPVFPAFVDILESPHIPGGLGSAPYDAEGVATRERPLIAGGILQSYVLSSYSARKLGLSSTGNAGGVHNLLIQPGELRLADLLQAMGTGLLITELMGQGVNLVTGDYSRGAAGFWVEQGEIVHPVEEITIAGNLKDLFRQLIAVGADVDVRGNTRTGSLWFESMTVAGD